MSEFCVMKSTRLIFLLGMLCYVQYSSAQSQPDSIKKWLIEPYVNPGLITVDSNWLIVPPGGGQWPPPVIDPWYPYEIIDIGWIDIPWGTIVWVQPQCGETFHENGKLTTRVECKGSVYHGMLTYWNEEGQKTSEQTYVEGKLHGKSTNWNNSGHKTYEYTYAYNRVFKEKRYAERGKILSVEHYKYDNSGTRYNHGICMYYEGDTKTINRYEMGKLNGYSRDFENGIKREETLYKMDVILSVQKWNENQQLVSETINDDHGQLTQQRNWDNEHNLLKDEYYLNGFAEGCWTSYNPKSNQKIKTIYKKNKIVTSETFKNEKLISHSDFTNGNVTYSIYYFENGEKSEEDFIKETNGNDRHIQKWNQEGKLIEDVHYVNDMFKEKGFYTKGDSSVHYYVDNGDNKTLKRWLLYQEDTMRMEYASNSYTNRNQVLCTNNYSMNTAGDFVRDGQWEFYLANTINTVLTYHLGEITGRAIYYATINSEPIPVEYGNYKNGIKVGIWTEMEGHIQHQYTFENGEKNGWYYKINSVNDTLIKAECHQGVYNGQYFEYYGSGYPCPGGFLDEVSGETMLNYPANSLRFVGEYQNGKKYGYWYFYLIDGFLKEEGAYENDVKVGKWIYWSLNERGRLKKNKVNTSKMS